MMNITIIGASAGVGLEAVKRALARNHTVTSLSRSAMNIQPNPKLIVLEGSALKKADLQKSFENADAVIVALGTGKSMKATTLYSDFANLLTELQGERNLQIPFIILTGFGAGESAHYHSFLAKLAFKFLLKAVYDDKTKMEHIISRSNIKWIIVRPALLNNKPLSEDYRKETTLYKGIKTASISRADVADYMVKQAENPTDLMKYVSLTGK